MDQRMMKNGGTVCEPEGRVVAAAHGACPWDMLYIYYIEGTALTEKRDMGPDFIGNWMEDGFSFLFFSRPSESRVLSLLDDQTDLDLIDSYTMTYNDWLGEKPTTFHIGRFTISPPWENVDRFFLPSFGAYHLVLDPGVVFGTGTHPTTRDCLEFLSLALRDRPVEKAMDLGCGTGLLSLAAARLNCPKVLAVDFNALAVRTTLRNIRLNRLDEKILAVQGLAEDFVDMEADLLVANIHYDIMKKILKAEGFIRKKRFILSGILNSQALRIEETLAALPVRILDHRCVGGVWHTFYGDIPDEPHDNVKTCPESGAVRHSRTD